MDKNSQKNNEEILFCTTGGCGAKLSSAALRKVLALIPKAQDENLIVGYGSSDDAAVYKISDNKAFVQTLDFFPPMVDDPFTFGQIAAANALSDVYAMGGEVKTALNIVCFPETEDLNILGKIIQGGASKVHEAGGVLAGGHTINDVSIKYGLSVTGLVDLSGVLMNNTPRPGDKLILTKPLGIGLVNCAKTAGEASENAINASIDLMTTLNKTACEVVKGNPAVHACTDVTGFSLIGHLKEMLCGEVIEGQRDDADFSGGFSAQIDCNSLKFIPEAYDYAKDFLITAAGQRNRNFVGDFAHFKIDDYAMEEILFDPQTSGGLLLSVDGEQANCVLENLKNAGVDAFFVGQVCECLDSRGNGGIWVV